MNTERNTHSKLIGYLLWLVGFTGAHRFYFGKPITGTIWFFTFGLLGIGWLIDLFLIPGMDRRADHKYFPGPRDHSLAWILLVFLGWFGVHRLYLNKWFSGLAIMTMAALAAVAFPIFFFFIPIIAIAWLIDLWTLNGQVSEFNRRHQPHEFAPQPA
jgi:TM2 domain-containing membrane protein YozV